MTTLAYPLARGNLRFALVLALFLAAGAAHAQWVWRDANGEVTYSDSPPPPNVSRSEILRQPTGASSSAADETPSAPPAPTTNGGVVPANARVVAPAAPVPQPPQASRPGNAPKTLAEQDADFRKRQADQQKAEEKQAQDEAQEAQRTEACNQARNYLNTLQSGARLMRPDANGERNFLDDEQRSAEIQKTQENIEKNC